MTKEHLHSRSGKHPTKDARGVLKGRPGDKPFREWWADYKKEEKALEEAKYARLRPR
jgi:hypothetical protein